MGSQRNCTWILGLAGFRVVTTESGGKAVDSRVTIRIEHRGSRGYGCSGCGRRPRRVRSARDRTWDDLPWASHSVTLIYAQRRVRCRPCGIRTEAIAFANAKARVTRRLRQQIGVDCQSMPTSHAAVRHGVSWGKARRAEHAFLREWDAHRPRPRPRQRAAVEAVCTDLHRPSVNAVAHQLPTAEIVFDTVHVLQHASAALDDVRRQEFFRAGAVMRAFGRGKRWLLLRRWKTGRGAKRGERAQLFAANRRLCQAYGLREQLDRLWTYKTREGVARGSTTSHHAIRDGHREARGCAVAYFSQPIVGLDRSLCSPHIRPRMLNVSTIGEFLRKLARPAGFEPATPGLEGRKC